MLLLLTIIVVRFHIVLGPDSVVHTALAVAVDGLTLPAPHLEVSLGTYLGDMAEKVNSSANLGDLTEKLTRARILEIWLRRSWRFGREGNSGTNLEDLAEKVNSGTDLRDLAEKVNSSTNLWRSGREDLGDLTEKVNSGTDLGDLAEKVNSGTDLRDLAEKVTRAQILEIWPRR
ncbi:hypothetical protein BHM03_00017506 [Ensete ventricosum]|nr:hypothetical protein BHM03_00017506 [Ensete ventricosum]